MSPELAKLTSFLSRLLNRFWRELLICGILSLLVGWASYRLSGKSAPILLKGLDVWFNADTERVFLDMTEPSANHYRTKVHPLFVLLMQPTVILLRNVTGLAVLQTARLLIAILAAIWITLLFCLFRTEGCRRIDATLFSILAAVSASWVLWLGVFETYLLGSISIIVALLAVQWVPRTRAPAFWMTITSVFSLSVTVTNWIAGLFATAVSFPAKRALQITANAFCIVVLLWGVEKFTYPSSQFFLDNRDESFYVNNPESGGPIRSIDTLVFDTIVMPTVPRRGLTGYPWPCLTVQSASVTSGTPLQLIAKILWLFLFGTGVWALWTFKEKLRLRIALGGTLAGQIALHAFYGPETFLYSLHFLPLLLAVAALGSLTRLRTWVLAGTAALILVAGANNISQLSNSLHYLRQQRDFMRKRSALRSDDFNPAQQRCPPSISHEPGSTRG